MTTLRKSNKEHKENGTYRSDRHGKWELPVERPTMPRNLHSDSKKVWKKVCDIMEAAGTISKVDSFALEILCDSIVLYRAAHRDLMTHGFIIESSTKYGPTKKTNPASTVRNNAHMEIMKILKEFGMTPAARGQRADTTAGTNAQKEIFRILNPDSGESA